ncbi:glycosyltransferase family 4 protein [Sagittula salina]|uniref:glycosyltransferase family 4 protein n=1 Tax=Sagittula salina TaxID=2820268 RepID=UPI001FD7CDFB|nr:glycosyltransferase family 4 protein [Sagittula salina]
MTLRNSTKGLFMTGLRLAFLSDMDPRDRNIYSGGLARMFDALGHHVDDITVMPRDWGTAEPLRRAILHTPVGVNMRLRWRAHYALGRITARRVEQALPGHDVLFGAYALHALSHLAVPEGMVTAFTSDAVQTVYRESAIGGAYNGRALGRMLDGWVERQERAVLRRLDVALWPSEWLRGLVDARYGMPAGVGQVVEWGANMAPPPPPDPEWLRLDSEGPVNLLVIGRDWFAKGGPLAFATFQALRAQGVDARLTVIGCTPPRMHRSAHVTVHRQLDKSVPEELGLFEAALARAHFLVQPSRESYGFAFCEASAWGVPSLCLSIGGVPVIEGRNGHALPPGATADDFAAIVRRYRADPSAYRRLSRSTRAVFEERLNWDAWARRSVAYLETAVAAQRARGL